MLLQNGKKCCYTFTNYILPWSYFCKTFLLQHPFSLLLRHNQSSFTPATLATPLSATFLTYCVITITANRLLPLLLVKTKRPCPIYLIVLIITSQLTFLNPSNVSDTPFSHLPDVLSRSVAVLVVCQVEPECPVLHKVAVARLRLVVNWWWLGGFCDVINKFSNLLKKI